MRPRRREDKSTMHDTGLRGKTALVTGAGRRIGRHIALALADAGVHIVIHYRRSLTEAESLRAELTARGVNAWLVRADFEDLKDTEESFRVAADAAGTIDFLVNN